MKRKRRRELHQAKLKSCPPSFSLTSQIETCSDKYETPEKFKKQIRQRTSECNRKLPESKELKCAVVGRVVGKMLNSPSTSGTMSQIIKRYSKDSDRIEDTNDSKLVQSVLQIQKYKAQRKMDKAAECVKKLKEKYMPSIRQGARKLNMHYTQLQRLLCVGKKVHSRSLSASSKAHVVKCFSSNMISLQLPFKRYSKYYYLRTSLAVAYDTYVKEQLRLGFRVLSMSSIYRCIKGTFRTRRKIPFKDTQCEDCVNNSLLVDSLIVSKVKGIKRRMTENILNSFCAIDQDSNQSHNCVRRKLDWEKDSEVITDHNRECIFRECQKCGSVTKLQESIIKENPDLDWSQEVTWHQWQHVTLDDNSSHKEPGQAVNGSDKKPEKKKRILDKIRYRGTIAQLLALFVKSVETQSIHLFHFRWQAFQFDECKKQLQDGDVMFVMDFATNYSHHKQDEVQSGFFCRKQTTLHPIVTYYSCPTKCGHLVRDEIMMLSEDLKHDSYAVNSFVEKAIEHLTANKIPIKRIIMWSDNCGQQYKSCKVFDALSNFENIPVMRNYFCASHGKAEADGAIGRLSMHIDSVVRSGTQEFSDVGEIYRYCNLKLKIHNDDHDKCCHWQRHYFHVSQINRDKIIDPKTVKGTLTLHSVRNVGLPGVIEVRESSCFCEICFLNEPGECKNARLVEDFAWASLYKNKKIEHNFENKLWDTYSLPYSHAKKPVFRPQSANIKASKTKPLPRTSTSNKRKNSKVSKHESGSEDSDYDDNLPLTKLQEVMKDVSDGISPIAGRTRKRLHKKEILLCDKQGEKLDLEDYERGGVQIIHDRKESSRLTRRERIQRVNRNRKVNVEKKTSTPKTTKVLSECYIDLSPITTSFSPRAMSKTYDNSVQLNAVQSNDSSKRNPVQLDRNPSGGYEYWEYVHKKLIACKTYRGLQELVDMEKNKLQSIPRQFVGDKEVAKDKSDRDSMQYIPRDIPQRFLLHSPVKIGTDGNCFCRSISHLVYGSQEHHLEIRCRIVFDSVINIINYTDNDYLMRCAAHTHKNCSNIAEYYCTYSGVKNIGDRDQTLDGIQSVYKEDVMRIRNLSEQCGPWQFHSAANVLNSRLFMVFPSEYIRLNTRNDMNRVFCPGIDDRNSTKEFCLLWTSTCKRDNIPLYNHIVPMVTRYLQLCEF